MDGVDGSLARIRKETSTFGTFLDRDLDALGTLIGVLLAVHYARLPDWFILAGMAYYLFSCAEWWREKRGLVLHPLPASRYRRYVAVVQSVFIALALLPVAVLPKSDMTAALVMIPVLAGFLLDWRIVGGYDLRPLSSE
jgi:CDP-diacylglycerol--glycerol-3-phosphate 3-phosphatidyltransferase